MLRKRVVKSLTEQVEAAFKDAQHKGWRKPKIRAFDHPFYNPERYGEENE